KRDVRRNARAFFPQRFFGDLNQDLLSFPEEFRNCRIWSRSVPIRAMFFRLCRRWPAPSPAAATAGRPARELIIVRPIRDASARRGFLILMVGLFLLSPVFGFFFGWRYRRGCRAGRPRRRGWPRFSNRTQWRDLVFRSVLGFRLGPAGIFRQRFTA